MLSTHLTFFACWVVYYALHSFLALDAVKARVPLSRQAYRLLYSLISIVLLIFVLLLGAVQDTFFVVAPSSTTMSFAGAFTIVGVFLVKRAFRNYSFRGFLGVKKEPAELKTDGIQGRMRHPLYTGTILIVMGYCSFNPNMINVVSLLSLLLYLPFGIYLEEKKLIRQFGQAYLDYRQEVPALFPRIFKSR